MWVVVSIVGELQGEISSVSGRFNLDELSSASDETDTSAATSGETELQPPVDSASFVESSTFDEAVCSFSTELSWTLLRTIWIFLDLDPPFFFSS